MTNLKDEVILLILFFSNMIFACHCAEKLLNYGILIIWNIIQPLNQEDMHILTHCIVEYITICKILNEAGHSKLVLWDNPEGWGEEGGGRVVQDNVYP